MKLEKIDLTLGGLELFNDFSLQFPQGKITVILGPSGCGKSSILNMLSQRIIPQRGQVEGGEPGQLSYVFQEPVLLPWKNTRQNMEFILPDYWSRDKKEHTVSHYLQLSGLKDFSHLYPHELSGGMKQRLTLARSFAYPADTLLMDEPFTGLDIKLKMKLMGVFIELWLEDRRTSLLVTHDIPEALMLGHRLIILSPPPTQKVLEMDVDIPLKDRSPHLDEIIELEKQIYQTLLA